MCGDAACATGKDSEEEILKHVIKHHTGNLKFRRRILHESTGTYVYKSETYPISIDTIKDKIDSGYNLKLFDGKIRFEEMTQTPSASPAAKKLRTNVEHDINIDISQELDNLDLCDEDITKRDNLLEEMKTLLPGVCQFLSEADDIHKSRFMQFLELMNNGTFPLNNICFQVFEDLIQWHLVENISYMRYSPEVRRFWFIDKRLFHGKFLHYMRGLGHLGQIISGESDRGHYSPTQSRINFPVPSDRCLNSNKCNVPDELSPGLLTETVEHYIRSNDHSLTKSHNLCGDLKKINADTSTEMGCIDLAGFEKSPTKNETAARLMDENIVLKSCQETVQHLEDLNAVDIDQLVKFHYNPCNNLTIQLKELILIQSNHIKELRHVLISKEYGLEKLLNMASSEGQDNWKKTRFAPAISFLKCRIIELKECIKNLLDSTDDICRICSFLLKSNKSFIVGQTVNLGVQENYICLSGLDKEDIAHLDVKPEDVTRYLQQGGDAWHELRNTAKCTGKSLLYSETQYEFMQIVSVSVTNILHIYDIHFYILGKWVWVWCGWGREVVINSMTSIDHIDGTMLYS